jgi:hypothetical protein
MGALSWSHDRPPNCQHGNIDTLVGGTFFMLNAKEARAVFEKLSASERESEEHGLKENSHTVESDPLTRKI